MTDGNNIDPVVVGSPAAKAEKTKADAAAKARAKPAARPATERVLVVTAKRPGFRRAGRAWPDTATIVRNGDLDEDQVEAVLADPMLVAYWQEEPVAAED